MARPSFPPNPIFISSLPWRYYPKPTVIVANACGDVKPSDSNRLESQHFVWTNLTSLLNPTIFVGNSHDRPTTQENDMSNTASFPRLSAEPALRIVIAGHVDDRFLARIQAGERIALRFAGMRPFNAFLHWA
jgi:hypothetical protein